MRLPVFIAIACGLAPAGPALATDPGTALQAIEDGAVLVTRDAVQAARAPIQSGWDAFVKPEPSAAPKLKTPPQLVRVPKPQPALRPMASDGPYDARWEVRPGPPRGSLGTPHIGLGARRHALSGIASYYWQGEQTASGERFDKSAMTAAHPTLPFGTKVRVRCRTTGRDVVVRINDRGPFKPGRVIDLSEGAAEVIGMRGRGLTAVQLEVIPR